MLDFLASVLATIIEGIGMFMLILNLFRFRARDYVAVIVSTNIFVGVTNYLMQYYDFYYDFSALINLLIMVSVLIFLLKVSLIDSIVMSLIGFVFCFIIQGTLVLLFTLSNKVSVSELRIEDVKYYLQILSGVIYAVVSVMLNRKHWWFTFIPFKRTFKIKLNSANVAFVAAFLVVLAILGLFVHLNNVFLYTVLTLLLVFLSTLHFTIKRERQV